MHLLCLKVLSSINCM